jgi:hypothetical protein
VQNPRFRGGDAIFQFYRSLHLFTWCSATKLVKAKKFRFSKVSCLTAESAESAENKSSINSAGSAYSAVKKKDLKLDEYE